MKEILFHGKRKDNGKWVEGTGINRLIDAQGKEHIFIAKPNTPNTAVIWVEVIPETVGQYTGLTDKNGKKISDGHILKFTDDEGNSSLYVAKWSDDYAGWVTKEVNTDCVANTITMDCWDNWREHYEIIGNIHDNPELLEAGE